MWFFFFKQKTAYELRISDWSSDVCSSDLRKRQRCAPAPVVLLVAPAGWTVRTSTGLAFPMDQLAADRIVPISGGGRKMSAGLVEGKRQQIYKIGRASCRERWCQDV